VAEGSPGVPLRVVTWNLRSFRDDPAAAVEVLRALRPDVLCAQELPRFLGWRWRVGRFARAAGLRLSAGGGGRGRGTGVLVAARVSAGCPPPARNLPRSGTIPLSHERGWHHRAVALAPLRLPGLPPGVAVTVAAVHFGLSADQRLRHVDELLAALPLADPQAAVVVAGDLNDVAGRPAWTRLTGRLADLGAGGAATFPARRPRKRIDTVLATGPVRGRADVPDPALGLGALLARATDHLPVVADLRVG
jgi:endonuclease/exonuclease/phosphatase family metal-dependent hydrolase